MKMQNEHTARLRGIIGTLLFHLLVVFLLLLLALRTPLPLPGEEGVEVSLGYAETGSGLVQPKELQPVQQARPVDPTQEQPEYLTQQTEEAPAIDLKKPVENRKPPEKKPQPEPKPREEPVVNPRALYTPHQVNPNESGNQGNQTNLADQGIEGGSPETTRPDGRGGIGDGISFSLEGRGALHLPKPEYTSPEQGRVVVKIWVDRSGKVVQALSGVQGTTITDTRLIRLAEDAALKSVFTPDPTAADRQVGTITYNFLRLN